jgi:two-component system, sensor histidine kinase and response regulator
VKRLFSLLLFFLSSAVSVNSQEISQTKFPPLEVLGQYIITGDTTGLTESLSEINANFFFYRNQPILYSLNTAYKKIKGKNLDYEVGLLALLAKWHKETGNSELYIDHLLKVIQLLSNHNRMEDGIWMLIDIGNLFYEDGDYGQARFFYQKAKEISNRFQNDIALAVVELNFGLIQFKNENYPLAREHFLESIKIRNRTPYQAHNAFTQTKLFELYLAYGMPDSSYYFLRKAEKLYYTKAKEEGLLHVMPYLINRSYYSYYLKLGQKDKALQYLIKGREYLVRENLREFYHRSIYLEANDNFEVGNFKEVINIVTPYLPRFSELHQNDLVSKSLQLLAKSHFELKQYEPAFHYYETALHFEDSIKMSASRIKLSQMRAIVELVERESHLQLGEKELALNSEKEHRIKAERNFFVGISVISVLSAFFLFFLLRRLRMKNHAILELHSELENQNLEIREKAIKLEHSNLIKNKLFSIIAHDLRAPLNILLGQVGVLKQKYARASEPSFLSTNLSDLENSLKDTVELFERLLQWSKLDKNEIAFNPGIINLEEIARQVVKVFEPAIKQKNISVNFLLSDVKGFADLNITHTLFRNLISNAVAAVETDGEITIQKEAFNKKQVMVSIIDNGKGFPKDWFQKFKENIPVEPNKSTHGLGLLLCKELALMNHGQLIIDEEYEYGAKVSFTLNSYLQKEDQTERVQKIEKVPLKWQKELEPLKNLKYYQASQIKNLIEDIEYTKEPKVEAFIKEVEKAVYLGNKDTYNKLLTELEYE